MDYLKDIVKQFEHEVLYFYNQTDIQNGYLITYSRHGEKELFPLITLTCVVVNNQTQIYKNIFHLTERLAVLKKRAKTKLKYRKREKLLFSI